MAYRPLLIAPTLLIGALLAAAPASAQINQPIAPPPPPAAGAFYAGEPPAQGPMQGGMPRQDWLTECARRLNNNPGMATADTAGTCERWWTFYQAGGAPHPTYGYAVPVSVTETTEECPEQVVETRVITTRKAIKRRVVHDKRVRI